MPLFAETFNNEVSVVLCEKTYHSCVEIVKMAKRTVCKKCARKIMNCYRMFAELREALAGCRALDKAKDL